MWATEEGLGTVIHGARQRDYGLDLGNQLSEKRKFVP